MNNDDKPLNRWGAVIGSDELGNLDFDFEDYFQRHGTESMSEVEAKDFQARIYGMYCRDFYKSGGDTSAIPKWVAAYVADRLFEGLQGRPWNDVMRLPWDKPTPWMTPKGERAFDIYAGVENSLNTIQDANITDLISEQASKHHVSYETARADYYAMKKAIKLKTGIPSKFLIDGSDF